MYVQNVLCSVWREDAVLGSKFRLSDFEGKFLFWGGEEGVTVTIKTSNFSKLERSTFAKQNVDTSKERNS